jgi:MFS family permease
MSSGRQHLASGISRGRRRGWRLVATLAASETTAYGVLAYAFGVFLVPMQQELGWSRTALTGAYALAIIVSGVAAIPVGRWLDRHGARALMTTGAGVASLLVLAWAQASDLAVFYAIWLRCCTSPRSRSSPAGTATPPSATGPCSA